ncbi:ATP-binding protein [Tenacibaculum sp. E3R01]|uniref:ATP-binding protein n=1 Tax=Tenacibaculum sp. E3R01 TaxID=2267227 RepID=UPI000DE94D32|nr:ATP-binding protein [Tenacibaculum sp. E3R01]RBW59535.1 ATP-binding protein [Tenacibaculum sp. E3R01]
MIKSLEEGRKEDGNRSIADKIIKRLHDLDKTVEYNQGRWAWELLQNAKDSTVDHKNHKISVQIILNDNQVQFKHNGVHFTEHDIRGLINQISSKEVEEGEQTRKTGRFGTGFLTTHLLSRTVFINGTLEAKNGSFYRFEFPLNRDGKTIKDLTPKIDVAWEEFHKSATEITPELYDKNDYNTCFSYSLNTDEQKQITKTGIDEFIKLLPYVLAFIPKIESIQIINNIEQKDITFKNDTTKIQKFITSIKKTENGIDSTIYILKHSGENTSIACQLEKINDSYYFKEIENLPKLFCDFPLIGTENFSFPMIVNSFYFNPLTERNGIWLKKENDNEVIENQNLIQEALFLYKELLEELSDKNYSNFFNVIETKVPNVEHINKEWYREKIQIPLRNFLTNIKIVELESEEKKAIKDIWFPSKEYTKEEKSKLWEFNYDLFPDAVSQKEQSDKWLNKSWGKWNFLDYKELAKDIEEYKNVDKLTKALKNKDCYEWLNSVGKFLLKEDANKFLIEKYAIVPNRNGEFLKKNELFIDKIKDEPLIEILKLLKDDWNNILINKNIGFGRYHVKEKKDIASQITDKVNRPNQRDENYNKAIILLSEWFEYNNPDDIKSLFSELHRKKAELFMNTIPDKESLYRIMKSSTDLSKVADVIDKNPKVLENNGELTSLLNDYNLNDVTELRRILDSSKNVGNFQSSELTQEDLAGLGVTSIEELEEALKDKDLTRMFHSSNQNVNSFLYAEKLISRAKNRIIEHLKNLPDEYDCSELDVDISKSAIGGIKKNGQSIYIVTRPSDNGFIIVYYGSEKDILDYENSELWVDNGIDTPKRVTLGKIIKNTGINKIPV